MSTRKTIVVTGADGFLGKNLCLRLAELERFAFLPIVRASRFEEIKSALAGADTVVHLAGVNRPKVEADFADNPRSVETIVDAMRETQRPLPVILASSAKAGEDSAYATSKRESEDVLQSYAQFTGAPVAICRLPNVFGKWCRPRYNSVVATFCHHVAHGLEITIHDPAVELELAYIDDVIASFVGLLDHGFATGFQDVEPTYRHSVGYIAELIRGFEQDRTENRIDNVGVGFARALYATYVSYLPAERFSYPVKSHRDHRGAFSEMLKTREAGQVSYFTAFPGMTRGGHYHHTKTEKFLVVQGEALFRFRHMLTGEKHQVRTSGDQPYVVETIPGWTHDVTNVGESLMISLLWANEVFDHEKPDTISKPL